MLKLSFNKAYTLTSYAHDLFVTPDRKSIVSVESLDLGGRRLLKVSQALGDVHA